MEKENNFIFLFKDLLLPYMFIRVFDNEENK